VDGFARRPGLDSIGVTEPARQPARDSAPDAARRVERTYLVLTLVTTLAASFIWGVNTLFLLDAGLSNTEAFTANAFFTVGQVVFEIPTGVVADVCGRRFSFLLGRRCWRPRCSTCSCGRSGRRSSDGRSRRS
jgi:hypothetical protein